jgi:hypothetical protein
MGALRAPILHRLLLDVVGVGGGRRWMALKQERGAVGVVAFARPTGSCRSLGTQKRKKKEGRGWLDSANRRVR